MSRRRKGPWFRKQNQSWYTTVNGQFVRLGSADDPWEEIERRYHEEHANEEKPSEWTVSRILDEFLDWCNKNREPSTYRWYRSRLQSFHKFIGDRLRVNDLDPWRVSKWVDKTYGDQSSSTRHGAYRCVVRAFNWAVRHGLIRHSPVAGIEKPTPESREAVISQAQFEDVLSLVRDQEFRDVLEFLWHTGARPQEFRVVEARHVDGRKIVLERRISKGKKRRRTIWLNAEAHAIVERLAKRCPEGPIFRNTRGNPWNKNNMSCRFSRLREKTGIDELCAYTLRHSYATRRLKEGLDSVSLGVLMGHANPSMIGEVYQHVAQDDEYMLSITGSATGADTSPWEAVSFDTLSTGPG